VRLQEHFTSRFKSVKAQHEEAVNRSNATNSKNENTSISPKRANNVNLSISSRKEEKEATEKQKTILQKG